MILTNGKYIMAERAENDERIWFYDTEKEAMAAIKKHLRNLKNKLV